MICAMMRHLVSSVITRDTSPYVVAHNNAPSLTESILIPSLAILAESYSDYNFVSGNI
jgi:hypothetical protein